MLGKSKYSETRLSNKKQIKIRLLPAITQGIPVARRLINLIAPVVGGTLDGLKHDEIIHGAPKTFSELSLVVCQQLEKVDASNLVFTLLDGMEVEGEAIDLDEYFSANYGEMMEVLEFALRENFESFFTGNGMKQRFLKVVAMIQQGHTEELSSEE